MKKIHDPLRKDQGKKMQKVVLDAVLLLPWGDIGRRRRLKKAGTAVPAFLEVGSVKHQQMCLDIISRH